MNLSALLHNPHVIHNTINIDVNILVLYGNNPVILQKCFYQMFEISNNVRETAINVDDSEIEYMFSDKHIELKMNDKSMKHMKRIVMNNNIANKKFLFLIKDCNIINHNVQFTIKRVIEKYSNATFVFIVKSLSHILPSITNMACAVNCKFPFENVAKYFNIDSKVNFDKWKQIYNFHDNDIINLMIMISNDIETTKLEDFFTKIFSKIKKEKNAYEITSLCREVSYKLFHMNVPISIVVKYILKYFEKHKLISDIVMVMAKCDHLACLSKKNIMVYEKMFLEVVNIVK